MKRKKNIFTGTLLDEAQMRANGHVKLLGFDNNTAIYLNEDGTKTLYVSSVPIETQKVQVQKNGTAYESTGSRVSVTMPTQLTSEKGIAIGEQLEVFPMQAVDAHTKQVDRANAFGLTAPCVVYDKFFGTLPLYCYSTGFGINMEIVIPKPIGNPVFALRLKQPEGYFSEIEPDYIDFRNEVDLQSMVYTPIAVDANGAWSYRNRIVLATGEDGKMIVHFVIDREFLADPNTKYPVTLNQSIYAYRHKQPDTAIYSQAGQYARHYLSPYLLLGENTPKGEGMALLRFEVLDDLEASAEDVLKAEYCFTNLAEVEKNVIVGAYAITNDWCSVNTKWKSKPNYDAIPVGTVMVRKKGVYGLDITRLLREMLQNRGKYEPLYSVRNSFLIKSNSKEEKTSLLLASGDAGFFPPYLKVILKNKKKKK